MKPLTRRQFLKFTGAAGVAVIGVSCSPKALPPTQTAQPTPTPAATPTATGKPKPAATSISLVNRYIAFCGIDCTHCPQYGTTLCKKGCLGQECSAYCMQCAIRTCNQERQVANCAFCEEYPCQKLETQFADMEKNGYGSWAKEARAVLDEVQHTKQ